MAINPAEIAKCSIASVGGTFHRHTSVNITDLGGSRFGGRWGPAGAFPVLYLGRPSASVAAEAYRHLVDPTPGLSGKHVGSRKFWTCTVNLTQVLDLRDRESRERLGLTASDLSSEVMDYGRCNDVAVVAHQLELHGIIAPSATGLGETLALFDQHTPIDEYPKISKVEIWSELPSDPRRLRLVEPDEGHAQG